MRVNIYKEELTSRVEIVHSDKSIAAFGVRFYLYLPVTDLSIENQQRRGPFIHHPGDDDSSAVTFWFPNTRAGRMQALDLFGIAADQIREKT